MPARKMRVELFDNDGNRYTIAFEGEVTREKAVRLLDLVELLGGAPSGEGGNAGPKVGALSNDFSKYDRVHAVVQRNFPVGWFSSREVQNVYEQELKEPISLSTVATYLSRLAVKGVLMKTGALNSLKYRLAQGFPQVQVKQAMS
jgi:hypothetical protein